MERIQAHRYLTQKEAADLLRLSERTLERLRNSGSGPVFLKAGARRVLYRIRDIEAWLTDRSFSSTSEAHVQRAPK